MLCHMWHSSVAERPVPERMLSLPNTFLRKLPLAPLRPAHRIVILLLVPALFTCLGHLCWQNALLCLLDTCVSERTAICCCVHLLLEFPHVSSLVGGLWPVCLGMVLTWQFLRVNAGGKIHSRKKKNVI